jgi:hypothetical protein
MRTWRPPECYGIQGNGMEAYGTEVWYMGGSPREQTRMSEKTKQRKEKKNRRE